MHKGKAQNKTTVWPALGGKWHPTKAMQPLREILVCSMHKVGEFPKILPKPKSGLKKVPIWATRKACLTLATLLFKRATSQKPDYGYKKPKPQVTRKPMLLCSKSMQLLQTNNNPDVIRIKIIQ